MIPTGFGITLVTFAVVHLAPGDPSRAGELGLRGALGAEAIAQNRRIFHLDLPLFVNASPEDRGRRVEAALDRLLGGRPAERAAARADLERRGLLVLPELARRLQGTGAGSTEEAELLALSGQVLREPLDRAGVLARAASVRGVGPFRVPTLMRELLDDRTSPGRRRDLADELAQLTGFRMPYDPAASDDGRAAVIAEWREHWAASELDYVDLSGARRWTAVLTETRYARWLSRLWRFDFGVSQHDQRRVVDKIAEALPRTALLAGLALLFSYGAAIPLGALAALRRGRLADRAIGAASFVLYSLPAFFVATLLLLLLGGVGLLDLFPLEGLTSPGSEGWSLPARALDLAWHLALPVFCLSYASIAVLARHQRAALLDALGRDYVRTARAKGLSRRTVVVRHALRNALLPMITMFGLQLPTLLGGSVIVEQAFGIPGMGLLAYESVLHRDYPTLMAIAVLSAAATLLGSLLADVLYAWADPRITA